MLNVEDLGFFLVLHKLLSFLWGAHSVQGDSFVYLPGTFWDLVHAQLFCSWYSRLSWA